MYLEFRAVLIAILEYLEHNETQRAKDYIEKVLDLAERKNKKGSQHGNA